MKKMTILLLFLSITPPTWGGVSTKVCLSDGVTPLELADSCIPFVYRDIMVGTKLTLIVASDIAEYWYGGALGVQEESMLGIGRLYGRDFDGFEYVGSSLPDAGYDAAVWDTVVYGYGFELYGGSEPNAGDWFILDYNALDVGDCNIDFYDFDVETLPIQTLVLHHVRTRDFNNDTKVDFSDFAILASHWQAAGCNELGGWCEGADLDTDGNVDSNDLMLFCEYWLEKTE